MNFKAEIQTLLSVFNYSIIIKLKKTYKNALTIFMWFGFGRNIEIERNFKKLEEMIEKCKQMIEKDFLGLINLLVFYWW